MTLLDLDVVEASGDPGGAIRVTGEEDVLGQFTRSESDVVLPFSDREGYAGIRVRQTSTLTLACFAGAKLGRG